MLIAVGLSAVAIAFCALCRIAISLCVNFLENANFKLYHIVMRRRKESLPTSRARLASVLRAAKEVISIDVASRTLGIDRRTAAKLMSRWREQGWLRRIGHGLYVPVSLDLSEREQVIADPW